MKPVKIILKTAMLMTMIACTNQSELVKEMTPNKSMHATDEIMGLSHQGTQSTFRIFAPSETNVNLVLFDNPDDMEGKAIPMTRKENGVWELSLENGQLTKFYGYTSSDSGGQIISDPYSFAVVRQNNYRYPSKSVILPQDAFDWEGDTFTSTPLADLVILEAHLRDMTIHPSSDNAAGGTYKGFISSDQKGGIAHLKDMGYNAIEFLPLQEFGNIEIDFKNPELSIWNDWNAYENNHWGYMTSFFFAPEIYYASDGVTDRGAWLGQDGRAVNEMKEMVKGLHKEGVSVIMDVVYNHVSQYDANPFKIIDKEYYFRLTQEGDYIATSGCGNDFKTENPMARKMIVESLLYWMKEYHIDGFRFDLATLIDMETVDAITEATRALNPEVILIGEPWGGGGYNPAQLADHGWASWNDHFRNSVKGRNPREDDSGFIFGKLWEGNDLEHYKKLMRGYLQPEGGHFREPVQSVNYLESHDDNTMGDFIRLALGKVGASEKVTREQVIQLSPEEIKIHKFAALNLLTSQGPVMIAQGQSWGRAKVIANSIGTDPHAGQLDHNSYDKDDETNWLDWNEKRLNKDLVDYYRGLVAIRNNFPEIRNVEADYRQFINGSNGLSFGVSMSGEKQVLVLLNADKHAESGFDLPPGNWTILANNEKASTTGLGKAEKRVTVLPQSGMILIQ